MSSDSDDYNYDDFEAGWDPYYCCDQFFTSTLQFKLHKLMIHGHGSLEDDYDVFGDAFSDLYGSFDDSDDSDDSSDLDMEFLDDYLTTLGTLIPSKKSKGKSKKSSLKIAKVSQAACKDRITYSCSHCNRKAFDVKAKYLEHTAVMHGICGVCDYVRQAGQRTADARFRDVELHFICAQNCVRNPKSKLGSGDAGVDVKKASHSREGDRRSFICSTCGDTQNLIKSLKCRVCKNGLVVPMPPPSNGLFDDKDDYCVDGLFGGGDDYCEADDEYFEENFGCLDGYFDPEEDSYGDNCDRLDLYLDPEDDSYGENFGCLDGYFDSEEGTYDDSEDEAMMKYIHLTSTMSSPPSNSKKESKKSRSKDACASHAHSSDHLLYGCSKCGMGPFPAKGPFLLHMAMIHKTCGVCEDSGQANQKTDFRDEDHYSYALSCVHNKKVDCGGRGGGIDNRHNKLSRSEGDKDLFVCLTCGDSQGSGKALNQHYATVHKKCRTCRIQFDTEAELYGHFSSSKVHLRKYCVPCKMVFCSRESLQIHCSVAHPTGTNYTSGVICWPCDACTKNPRAFPKEEDLEVHIQSEHVRCFPCKREFVQKKSLHDHLVASSKHNFCIRCDSDFVSSQSFIVHKCPGMKVKELEKTCTIPEVSMHNLSINEGKLGRTGFQSPDLSCCVCEETFDSLEGRMWHEYDNHLWCSKCDKQLASREAFNEHQATCERHSMCFECGDHFLTPEKLVHHQQITKHAFPFANIPSNCNVKTRKFVCDSCDYKVVFETEEELAMHLTTHA